MLFSIILLFFSAFCDNSFASVIESIEFDAITSEQAGNGKKYTIGWVKVFGCTEGHDSSESKWTYPHNGNMNYMKQIAPYAITTKIVPAGVESGPVFDNYAVFSKICSNPVVALNHLNEVSYSINVNTLKFAGQANINNWYGSKEAKERLTNTCGKVEGVRKFSNIFYHACGNVDGIHIVPGGVCEWEWEETFGTNIDVYLGFDASKSLMCDGKGTGGLSQIPLDHLGWLKIFECSEGRSQDINNIRLNPDYSEAELRALFPTAISIKILARGNTPGINEANKYALTSEICSSSVIALNNGKEISYKLNGANKIIGFQNIGDWYGTSEARARLSNSCYDPGLNAGARDALNDVFYHACGNHGGLHIIPRSKICEWDWEDAVNKDIEVWIAYDLDEQKCCVGAGLLGACPVDVKPE